MCIRDSPLIMFYFNIQKTLYFNFKTLTRVIILTFLFLLSQTCYAAIPTHDSQGKALPTLAPLLKKINPAVVNIATYSQVNNYNPLLNDPFFRHFFSIPRDQYRPRSEKRQKSAGSGVIVDAKKGLIITNFHVVKGADEIEVSLTDGRTIKAKLLGQDKELDVAILQINEKDLTDIRLANSSTLEVGDFVIAIGNPFGIGQTVTTGIVSALGRTGLGIEGYENFIQTDASINPGNSGGALVNLRGELIGINTAIISPAGGNVGIGFAIPINMAKISMDQILNYGQIKRGRLGIRAQDISQELRQAFNLKAGQKGALINEVINDSSASKAGLKSGDIIVAINNDTVSSLSQLNSYIANYRVGTKITLKIIRHGKPKTFIVTTETPEQLSRATGNLHRLLKGVYFENGVSEYSGNSGVVVSALEPNSTAAYSGLRPGDIVVAANKIRVTNLKDLKRSLRRSKREILLEIDRQGRFFYVVIN